jgi:hypothetical protein
MEDLSCRVSSSCRAAMATVMQGTVGVLASFHNSGMWPASGLRNATTASQWVATVQEPAV